MYSYSVESAILASKISLQQFTTVGTFYGKNIIPNINGQSSWFWPR